MKITFYHSALCPRCLMVGRTLLKLQNDYPDLEIEKIEVTTSPLQSFRQGVRMIPTLSAVNLKLAGIYLTQDTIRNFLEKLYHSQPLD